MAVPVLTASAGSLVSSASIVDTVIVVPAGSNLIAVWIVNAFGPTFTIPIVTMIGGPTLTLVTFGGTAGLRQIGGWFMVSPPPGPVTIRVNMGGAFNGAIIVHSFSGVDTGSPVIPGAAIIAVSSTGSSLSVGSTANDLSIDALGSVIIPTVGPGQTQTLTQAGPAPHVLYTSSEPGPSPTMSWSWAGFQPFVHAMMVLRGSAPVIVTPASAVAMSIVPLPALALIVRLDIDVAVVLTPDQSKEVQFQV